MNTLLTHIPCNRTSQIISAAVGIACCLRLLGGNVLFKSLNHLDGKTSMLALAFFLVALFVAFLVAAFWRTRIDKLCFESPIFSFGCLATCAIGRLLIDASLNLAPDTALWFAFSSVLYAGGLAASLISWGSILYRLDERTALMTLILAFPLFACLGLTGSAQPFGIKLPNTHFILALMCLCWFFAYRPSRIVQPRYDAKLAESLPALPIAILLISVVVCSIVIGVLNLDDLERETGFEWMIRLGISLLLAAALFLGSRLNLPTEKPYLAYSGICVLVTFIVLFVALVFQYLESSSHLPSTLINITRRLCLVGMLIVISKSIHEKALSPTLLFSLFGILAIAIPEMIGRYFVPVLNESTDELIAYNTEIVILSASAVLTCATLISLIVSQMLTVNENAEVPVEVKLQNAYDSVSQEFGLTPREQEVMQLIAKGTSMKGIAERLFISHGTVQTHSKNIYRKLDVHSRQELADLIENHCK